MVAILAFSLLALQNKFDEGDLRRAIEMLAQKAPGASWSVAQELDWRSGATLAQCEPRLLSSFAGTLEITCRAGATPPYRFWVDLVRRTLTPQDAHAKELLEVVTAKNAAPRTDAG